MRTGKLNCPKRFSVRAPDPVVAEQLLPTEEEEEKFREDYIREQAALFNFYEVGERDGESCRTNGGFLSAGAPRETERVQATENRFSRMRRKSCW